MGEKKDKYLDQAVYLGEPVACTDEGDGAVHDALFIRLNAIITTVYQTHMEGDRNQRPRLKGVSVSTMRPSATPTLPTVVPPTTTFLDHCRSSGVHLRTALRDWRRRSPCGGTRNRRHRSIAAESRPSSKRCGAEWLHRCTSNRTTVPARRCHRSTLLVRIGCLGRATSHSCTEASHSAGGSPTVRRHSWLERLVVDSTRKMPISLISYCFMRIWIMDHLILKALHSCGTLGSGCPKNTYASGVTLTGYHYK